MRGRPPLCRARGYKTWFTCFKSRVKIPSFYELPEMWGFSGACFQKRVFPPGSSVPLDVKLLFKGTTRIKNKLGVFLKTIFLFQLKLLFF